MGTRMIKISAPTQDPLIPSARSAPAGAELVEGNLPRGAGRSNPLTVR
jgi:hypothetical protein